MLKKVMTASLQVKEASQALIVRPWSMSAWKLFSSVGFSNHNSFLMCDIAELWIMQSRILTIVSQIFQILPENLSAISLASSQTSFASAGAPISSKIAPSESEIRRCFVQGTTIDLTVAFSTGCDLEHAAWFIIPLMNPYNNRA